MPGAAAPDGRDGSAMPRFVGRKEANARYPSPMPRGHTVNYDRRAHRRGPHACCSPVAKGKSGQKAGVRVAARVLVRHGGEIIHAKLSPIAVEITFPVDFPGGRSLVVEAESARRCERE